MRTTILMVVVTLLVLNRGMSQSESKLPAPIPLNHFYVVVDSATYKAIEQSAFLREEFAVSEQRTTTRTDITYTGLYFYGTHTYFEFFDAGSTAMGKLSDCGLAFGVDQPGTIEAIEKSHKTQLNVLPNTITRQFEGKQVSWFNMAIPTNIPVDAGFRLWLMEYHSGFLAAWNPQAQGENRGISREQILARYAAVLKDKPAKPLLLDVVKLSVALNSETRKEVVKLAELFGYRREIKGASTLLSGEDIELTLIPQTETVRGIQQITMRVAGQQQKQSEFHFGPKSVLKFQGDGLATWTF